MRVTVSTPVDHVWVLEGSFVCPATSWLIQVRRQTYLPLLHNSGSIFRAEFVVSPFVEITIIIVSGFLAISLAASAVIAVLVSTATAVGSVVITSGYLKLSLMLLHHFC